MNKIERMDTLVAQLPGEVYRVGGSVRDELLEREPKDADYVVRGMTMVELGYALVSIARPMGAKVQTLVTRDGVQTGFTLRTKFGSADIVLPRKEVSTGPGHSDFKLMVDPNVTLLEDSFRRDFTFNALYMRIYPERNLATGHNGGVEDPTGRGLYDLERRMINTTHEDSFRDDPLRILRALRFVARGYELGSNTLAQMKLHADAVDGLTENGFTSGTVFEELTNVLTGTEAVAALRLARDTGVLERVLPELEPMIGFDQESKYHDFTVDEHTFKALEAAVTMDAPLRVRWALLFHDSGKPETAWRDEDGLVHYYSNHVWASQMVISRGTDSPSSLTTQPHEAVGARIWLGAARRLGVPAKLRDDVGFLIRAHMLDLPDPKKVKGSGVRKQRVRLGDAMLEDLILHRACDVSGKGKLNPKQFQSLARMREIQQEAIDQGVPSSVADLQINGHDLIDLGITGGAIGRVLDQILISVVATPTERLLSREWQLAEAKRLKRR